MVSFRRLFMVGALVAAITGVASAAGTPAINCTGTVAPGTVLRAEGVAELVENITIGGACSVTNPTAHAGDTATFSIQVFTSGGVPVTSLVDTSSHANDPVLSTTEVRLVVNGTSYPGTVNGNAVTFGTVGLPIDVVGPFSLVVHGLRVDATKIAAGTALGITSLAASADQTVTSSNIFGGSAFLTVNSVAVSLNSLGTSKSFTHFVTSNGKQLIFKPCDADTGFDITKDEATNSGHALLTINFQSLTAGAFKPVTHDQIEDSPDGTNGRTRLTFSLTNVPTGVTLYAPTLPAVPLIGGATGTASLLVGYDANLAGGYPVSATHSGAKYQALTPDANGTVTAVYYLDNFSPNVNNSLPVTIYASVKTPVVSASKSVLSAGFAPLAASTNIPRFAAGGVLVADTITTAACTSTLLFPYVVSGNGYDTGLAISNSGPTTADSTKAQAGDCLFTFYGAGAPAAYTLKAVPAAGTSAFDILSAYPSANFAGYAVAVCQFSGVSGYAFVANSKGSTASYLPLVAPTAATVVE